MKTYMKIRVLCVNVFACVCVCGLLGSLWGVARSALELRDLVEEWQRKGPHTSFLGRVREGLAAARWLGPLRPSPPRNPLEECKIPTEEDGWWAVLLLLLDVEARLACLKESIEQARHEHQEFETHFLVSFGHLVFVPGLCVLLRVCIWAWQTVAQRRQRRQDDLLQEDAGLHDHHLVRRDPFALERRVLLVVLEMATPLGLMLRRGRYVVCLDEDVLGNGHAGATLTLPAPAVVERPHGPYPQEAEAGKECFDEARDGGHENEPPNEENSDRNPLPPEAEAEAVDTLRRSVVVPRHFRERLVGPGQCFLEYLRYHHSVTVTLGHKKMHILGPRSGVLACYQDVRAILAKWRRLQAQE